MCVYSPTVSGCFVKQADSVQGIFSHFLNYAFAEYTVRHN